MRFASLGLSRKYYLEFSQRATLLFAQFLRHIYSVTSR